MKHTYSMLVVDDEATARSYVLRQIEWERLDITTLYEAQNGLEAWQIIQEKHPDLMILDIRMPGMDGVELLEQICQSKTEISVVGLSGYSDFEAARKMLSSGRVVEYLLKPASADALFEAVTRCLTRIEERQLLRRGQALREEEEFPDHVEPPAEGAFPAERPSPAEGPFPAGGQPASPGQESLGAPAEEPSLGGGRKRAVVQQAKEYIQAHYMEKLSLDTVAGQVYLNPSYLSRIFTESEGMSFVDYIQWVRVQRAKELLADPRYKVYEVADQVGYPNFKHFLKVFKKLEQKTPSQYRETAGWLSFSEKKK